MQIRIAICDDEKQSLEMIQKEVLKAALKLNIIVETYLYADAESIIDLICNQKDEIDILFLDIDMPEMSGLEVARKIRERESEVILIFISAHEQYVFESLDYNPFQYIRKNKMQDELEIVLNRAYKRILSENKKSIVVKTETGEICLNHADIMYIEMESRKINIYIYNKESRRIAGRKTIKEIYKELEDEEFIQIHSGCIVNVKYIREYSKDSVTLDNEIKLNVSRSRVNDVKQAVSRYWREKI